MGMRALSEIDQERGEFWDSVVSVDSNPSAYEVINLRLCSLRRSKTTRDELAGLSPKVGRRPGRLCGRRTAPPYIIG